MDKAKDSWMDRAADEMEGAAQMDRINDCHGFDINDPTHWRNEWHGFARRCTA